MSNSSSDKEWIKPNWKQRGNWLNSNNFVAGTLWVRIAKFSAFLSKMALLTLQCRSWRDAMLYKARIASSIFSWQYSRALTRCSFWQYKWRCSKFPLFISSILLNGGQKGHRLIIRSRACGFFFQFFKSRYSFSGCACLKSSGWDDHHWSYTCLTRGGCRYKDLVQQAAVCLIIFSAFWMFKLFVAGLG